MSEAYIVATARTAGGRRNGRLSGTHPADLAGRIVDALIERSGVDPAAIEDVILGCVSQIGEQTSNIARSAVLSSRLPETVPGTTVDRQCGSSQQALHFAAQAVLSGTQDIVIAGGVESMSRQPIFSPSSVATKAGMGFYKGPAMDRRYPGVEFNQFNSAETIARKYGIDKEALDRFALRSHQRAAEAANAGAFADEIVPLDVQLPDGSTATHSVDEGIRFDASLEGIAGVKLIQEGGRITAASSSQICDGASGVLVVNERGLKILGVEPLARVHHLTVRGDDPVNLLEAPLPAAKYALAKAGMSIDDIDLYEVNEAFASVPLAWLQALDADPERLNVHGGAIALGHPLGASGTRLMITLIHALRRQGKRWGLQAMCEGGGLANITVIERL
ncbi:MAG: acetyl-CoA C-acetyltransferase [Pseudoxanthomonas sp.]